MKEPWVLGGGRVFTVSGWIDVHHPCHGRHRLLLRVGLPDRYACWESMRELVAQVKAVFGLPDDESYHVYIAGLSQQICREEPVYEFQSTT